MRLLAILPLLAAGAFAQPQPEPTGAPPVLDAALQKLIADDDRWASTRTMRVYDKDGRLERTDVERYNPSLPPDDQWRLVLRNGTPPSAGEVRSWQRQREREMRRRGRPLGAILDFPRATVADETAADVIFTVPILPGASRRLPAEKFYVLMQVSKERGELVRFALRTTEAFRVVGVARVDNVEADAHFGVIDPQYVAQPVKVTAAGAGRVVWLFRVGGRAEISWSDFQRVQPYSDRYNVTIGELKALDF